MRKERILKKEDLLGITGTEMPCAKKCKIGHMCAEGYRDENNICDANIKKIKEKLLALGYISETRTRDFFGIRVLDHNSKNLPFPPLGDVLVDDGKLGIR